MVVQPPTAPLDPRVPEPRGVHTTRKNPLETVQHTVANPPAGPRAGPETLRPVRPVGLALIGREPRVAFDLAADRGGVPADQAGDPPYVYFVKSVFRV